MSMDDTSYFRELEQYRALPVDQLLVKLQALRCQLRTKGATLEARQLVFERFEIAWLVYEEKGGKITQVFPMAS